MDKEENKKTVDFHKVVSKLIKNSTKMEQMERYVELLEEKNSQFNLTGFSGNKLWEEGILESILTLNASYSHLDLAGKKLLDIGSGAGFPSIPYSIVHPEINITIFEPLKKRATFLKDVVKELNLNVTVFEMKIQKLNRVKVFDFISARAVANLKKLFPVSRQLIKDDGLVSLIKGPKVFKEVKELDLIWNQENFKITKVEGIKDKTIYLFHYSNDGSLLPGGKSYASHK